MYLMNTFFFFSCMSQLSLGGDGSLYKTALFPTDSTGERISCLFGWKNILVSFLLFT